MSLPSPPEEPSLRRRAWPTVAVAAMVGSVVVAWLPWFRSGQETRNSYEALRSAQRLGIDQLTPFRVVWFLVPVAALAAIGLLALTHRRSAAAVVGATGVVVVAAAVSVLIVGVDTAAGVWSALIVGIVAVIAAVALVAEGVRSSTGPDRGRTQGGH